MNHYATGASTVSLDSVNSHSRVTVPQQEDVEDELAANRLKNRLAQRLHRSRQKDKIQRLEYQVSVLTAQLRQRDLPKVAAVAGPQATSASSTKPPTSGKPTKPEAASLPLPPPPNFFHTRRRSSSSGSTSTRGDTECTGCKEKQAQIDELLRQKTGLQSLVTHHGEQEQQQPTQNYVPFNPDLVPHRLQMGLPATNAAESFLPIAQPLFPSLSPSAAVSMTTDFSLLAGFSQENNLHAFFRS
ncbi:hypothetical protein BC830DRAFT_1126507 [Chytriomyces sp. MP71]|nr:hypothetical protein BC830DRAFT_1126507 [Chytriomyces sp. MP71]